MTDLWGFLLQTLTASGVAGLLLLLKALFRDKLPPKWQFGIWGVLAVSILCPAGLGGRYSLVNWGFVLELLKGMAGEYTFTQVMLPFPLITKPETVFDWLFVGYAAGAALQLGIYTVSYLRLKNVLRHGQTPSPEVYDQLRRVGEAYDLPVCGAVIVPGLPSAFLCGVLRPVLVLPDADVDDKVILHELIHLKNRDTVWSMVICLLRSLHWCNPLLAFCAKQAGNDLEARCDQMVLELLEGEDRRDYGKILLSMANDRYANTPGATCVNNGGKAIRQRIEAIARFRLYPAGMGLVSVCVGIILLLPIVVGTKAVTLYDNVGRESRLASARSVYCTTPAGAFDCYAKAVLTGKDEYRIMCAPEDMQAELAAEFDQWEPVVPIDPVISSGYYIYNLVKDGNGYEGLLVMQLSSPPADHLLLLGAQRLRVEQERGRWVVRELEAIWSAECPETTTINWSCFELPAFRYGSTHGDFEVELRYQTVYDVDNWIYANGFYAGRTSFDTTAKPDAEFSQVAISMKRTINHLGTQEQRDEITHIGLGLAPVMVGEECPEGADIYQPQSSSSFTTDGESWTNRTMEPGWGPFVDLYGGGSKYQAEEIVPERPEFYLCWLYINHEFVADLKLLPLEGGT